MKLDAVNTSYTTPKVNFSGKNYTIVDYGVNEVTETIDYEELERIAGLR